MLQKLTEHIRGCYERAGECAKEAKTEQDEKLKENLLRLERSWTHLAKSYEFVESLEAFLLDAHQHRMKGD